MQSADSLEKTWMLGEFEGKKKTTENEIGWHHRLKGRKELNMTEWLKNNSILSSNLEIIMSTS